MGRDFPDADRAVVTRRRDELPVVADGDAEQRVSPAEHAPQPGLAVRDERVDERRADLRARGYAVGLERQRERGVRAVRDRLERRRLQCERRRLRGLAAGPQALLASAQALDQRLGALRLRVSALPLCLGALVERPHRDDRDRRHDDQQADHDRAEHPEPARRLPALVRQPKLFAPLADPGHEELARDLVEIKAAPALAPTSFDSSSSRSSASSSSRARHRRPRRGLAGAGPRPKRRSGSRRVTIWLRSETAATRSSGAKPSSASPSSSSSRPCTPFSRRRRSGSGARQSRRHTVWTSERLTSPVPKRSASAVASSASPRRLARKLSGEALERAADDRASSRRAGPAEAPGR